MRTIRMMRITGSAALAMLIVSLSPAMASGPPPIAAISCPDCVSINQISADSYIAYVTPGATITLSGNPGYQYAWTQNGLWVSNAQSIRVTIISGVQYSLTVTDYGGIGGTARSDTKTVQINLASVSQTTCVPALGDAAIDSDGLNRIDFAVGDKFSIKTDYDESECANIRFHWEADDPGIFIENPSAKETFAVVKAKPLAGKNPTIKAIASNGISQSEKDAQIAIVDNAAPVVKGRYTYTTPLSHTEFQVSCSKCWTGNGYNENGDFIAECSAILRNAAGQVAYSGTVTAKRGETLSAIALEPGDEGRYTIEVIVKDSHGLSSSVIDPIPVGFGNTEDDVPYIRVNETIFCIANNPCAIDTSKTEDHGLGIHIRYDDVTRARLEPLYNAGGSLCVTFKCTPVFKYAYAYKVKITAAYIRNGKVADKHSEKIITVVVGETSAPTPAQTPAQTIRRMPTPPAMTPMSPVLTARPPPIVPAKPSPGVSPAAAFATVIAVAVFLRKRKY